MKLFVLQKSGSGQLSSILWYARGTSVSWANGTVDFYFGQAMRRPAPTRPDLPVVCPGIGFGMSKLQNHEF